MDIDLFWLFSTFYNVEWYAINDDSCTKSGPTVTENKSSSLIA